MSSGKKNIYIQSSKVILITLLIVFFIRSFFIESFSVSTSQMEASLLKGDKILIDKTAYGIRLPITLLSIPFAFDNIFGLKSYSTALQAPYKRLFGSKVSQNDILLFNNPQETDKPLDKRSLLLSRCAALPGDTIQEKEGILLINGQPYISSPYSIEDYYYSAPAGKELEEVAGDLQISISSSREKGDTLFTRLNRYDAFVLNESLADTLTLKPYGKDSIPNYTFTVPSQGSTINLNGESLVIYGQIVLGELEGQKATIENSKLFINGVEQKEYTFTGDYYWMLSDNTANSVDSRSAGFIPFRNIIGKARLIWYSSGEAGIHSGRCFSSIK